MGRQTSLKGEGPIIVITYQSAIVLKILKSGKVYRAHRNLRFDFPYTCLVKILNLHCECPIFGCLKYHRKCTNGKVSSSVKLVLKVPDDQVWLTEYATWADFMYNAKYAKPQDFTKLKPGTEEISQRRYTKLIRSLKKQRGPWSYRVPQAVLQEIRPEWLVSYAPGHGSLLSSAVDSIKGLFH